MLLRILILKWNTLKTTCSKVLVGVHYIELTSKKENIVASTNNSAFPQEPCLTCRRRSAFELVAVSYKPALLVTGHANRF